MNAAIEQLVTSGVETDEAVVRRVLAGEASLYEVLMRRHNQRVYRAARAILRDDAEAEDVMQDAWVRAYAHLADFDGRARFSTWLTRIAVHEALARLRKRRRQESFDAMGGDDEMSTSDPTPEQSASGRELGVLLDGALDALPESFRTVFVLRAIEEMSTAETAACLDIPEDTVKTRLHRARGALQRALLSRLESTKSSVYDFHLSRCDRVVDAVFSRIGARRA